jgi:hypothetical protein
MLISDDFQAGVLVHVLSHTVKQYNLVWNAAEGCRTAYQKPARVFDGDIWDMSIS